MAVKIDLHSHSEASHDGGITPEQFADLLKNEVVDMIAITDHDRIDFAKGMQKALGSNRIIVGQEVTTTSGDILGLYLKHVVPSGLTSEEAMNNIHEQGGIVCVPHPFETVGRKGLPLQIIDQLKGSIDIIEEHNGRAVFFNYSSQAKKWAQKNNKLTCASSDAHGSRGVGRTYTVIESRPKTAKELLSQLSNSRMVSRRPPFFTLLYPLINRMKHKISGYS